MATDRLRRRLRDVEHNEVSALQHNFCGIGTPLPALDARKKDANELKPIWQQEARDEQGRRRFHGAFTGGFSAGYYNTVGSKEGWNPSSFRSSRTDKVNGVAAKVTNVRPEDYMDEEDLQDRKQTQHVLTSSAYAGSSSKTHDPFLPRNGPAGDNDVAMLASALYQQMNPKQQETLGFRLLQRMGWKEGQGLGARIDAAKRRRLLQQVQTGASYIDVDEKIIDAERKHLFAPPKTEVPQLKERKGRHGLGWVAGTNLHEALSATQTSTAPRDGLSSQSGLALPSIRSAAQPDSDEEDDPFGDEAVTPATKSTRLRSSQPRADSQMRTDTTLSETGTWRDGREMLSGFLLSSHPATPVTAYSSGSVPEGWSPDPTRVIQLSQVADLGPQERATRERQAALSPAARGQLLGEAKLPGPPPTMPAFLSQQSSSDTSHVHKDEFVDVPRTDVATAKLALQGFMPFPNDPEKQAQYRLYLESQLDPAEEQAQRQLVPITSTAEQFGNLLKEFASSAAISRLMSSTMANRFTSASAVPSAQELSFMEPGLRQPSSIPQPQPTEAVVHVKPPIQSPETSSATTKDEASIRSSKGAKGREAKINVDQHWQQNKEQLKAMAASSGPSVSKGLAERARTGSEEPSFGAKDQLGLGDDHRQGRDTLDYTTPTLEVLKSIFESEDEDQESEKIRQPRGEALKSKLQDPTSAVNVTFQARSKRQDRNVDVQATKKRKKEKTAKKKGMLSFNLEEGADD